MSKKIREGTTSGNIDYFESRDAEPFDPVKKPQHYQHPSGIECIEITQYMDFLLGNTFKYIWRFTTTESVQDLKKACWYLERKIKLLDE